MITTARPVPAPYRSDRLDGLPLDAFVARWRLIVGEPPATMLASRAEMIRMLVESVPAAGLRGPSPRVGSIDLNDGSATMREP